MGYIDVMVTKTRVSLSEFLAMEECKPYLELVDGEVLQKSMPNAAHSALVWELNRRIGNYLHDTREGRGETELRHVDTREERVYLPDVAVTLKGPSPAEAGRGPVEIAPDFAIEVLSPDDRAGDIIDRVQFYLRAGVQLTWIVDPERETVTVYRPGAAPEEHRAPEKLDARPVLASFEADLAELFAVLHDGEDAS